MGWNDHLPDPDAWEDHVEALAERADLDRKRRKEAALVPLRANDPVTGAIASGEGDEPGTGAAA